MHYADAIQKSGEPLTHSIDAPATNEQLKILKNLSVEDVKESLLAGEKIEEFFTHAS